MSQDEGDFISFQVAEGEILGFLGPNGAGKTTTFNVLIGQIKPKDGKATVLGWDIAKDSQKVHRDIGVCFEVTNLYEQMSARENLILFARLFDIMLIAMVAFTLSRKRQYAV